MKKSVINIAVSTDMKTTTTTKPLWGWSWSVYFLV